MNLVIFAYKMSSQVTKLDECLDPLYHLIFNVPCVSKVYFYPKNPLTVPLSWACQFKDLIRIFIDNIL